MYNKLSVSLLWLRLFLKCYQSKFLYSLQLYDISLQFDPADQPIRLFQREKNTDSILLVIERENNLLPVRIISFLKISPSRRAT